MSDTKATTLLEAMKAAMRAHKPPPIHSVKLEDGLAIFLGESGNVLGVMNAEHYRALLELNDEGKR